MQESYFDGGLLQLIGYQILCTAIIICTLGIATPWAICILYSWETKHTIINGHRLYFDGTGLGLIGKWIIWFVLIVITLGIYSFWVVIAVKKWKVSHTHFAD